MNRSLILIIAVLGVAAIGAGVYFSSASEATRTTETNTEVTDVTMEESSEDDAMSDDVRHYAISEGSEVRYIAMKGWLQKEAEEVIGTNPEVTGDIVFDDAGETFTLEASIDSQAFSSGSGGRDRDVQKMFTDAILVSTHEPVAHTDGTFEGDVLLDITINGVTQTVPFTIVANMSTDMVTAQGDGTLTMSDFGVKAPSVLNLYNVSDELGLAFDITAK